jgi:capsular exopolysaccharide synthesis family protein
MSDYQTVLMAEWMARTYAQMLEEDSALEAAAEKLQLGERVSELAGRVEVEPIPDTQLLRVSVEAGDATLAALFANAIADTFIERIEASQAERNSDFLASLEGQMEELSTQIEATQKRVDALGEPTTSEKQSELAHLESILAGHRNTYATLLQNYEQMRLSAARTAQAVTIAEAARPPESPVQNRLLYVVVAGLVGAIVGLGAAFLLEYMDDTIKTPRGLKRALGLKPISTVSRMNRADRGLIVAAQPGSAHAEAFSMLCTNVGFFYGAHDFPRTILVTSASSGEGKSLISANLAMTLAKAGFRVVAVDADLRRPQLSRFFDLDPRSVGLTRAVLTGSVDGLLQPSQEEQLAILTSGALPADPAGLFRSQNMQNVLDELAQRADVILIDGPPMLPVADTALIAHKMDGALLVVRAGRTRVEVAQLAMENLCQTGTHLIGVVLNDVDPRRSVYHSSYHQYVGDVRVEPQVPPEQALADARVEPQLPPEPALAGARAEPQVLPGQALEGARVEPHIPPEQALEGALAGTVAGRPAGEDLVAQLREAPVGPQPDGVATSPGEKVGQSEYEPFAQRELSEFQVEYLFLDALHGPLPKPRGDEEEVLCAWAINADGRKVLLHVAPCDSDSYQTWFDFLRDMVDRGLSAPVLATSHGTSDQMRAAGEVFPNSLQQRCLSHRIRAVRDEIPRSARAEVMAMVQAAYYAPNPQLAERNMADALQLYSAPYPTAMRLFQSDWETCIAYLRCPPAHHSRIRTTTLLQRSFAKERRQILDSPQAQAEKGSLELTFALLWQSSQRWQPIRMGEAERQQLRLLRHELGLLDGGQETANDQAQQQVA